MKKILLALLLLATLSYGENFSKVVDCKEYCDPMVDPLVRNETVVWFNSDEWGRSSEYYDYGDECRSLAFCKAVCWIEYLHQFPASTDEEMREAIMHYEEMAEEFLALPESYCGGRTIYKLEWTMEAYGHIANYSSELGEYLDAAEAYHLQGAYYEKIYEEGLGGEISERVLATRAYRESAKAYCELGMDEEAHAELENTRRVYRSFGDIDEEAMRDLLAPEECGKYAQGVPGEEGCAGAFVLIGIAAASIICASRKK